MADGRLFSVAVMTQEAANLSEAAASHVGAQDAPDLVAAIGRLREAAVAAASLAQRHAMSFKLGEAHQ